MKAKKRKTKGKAKKIARKVINLTMDRRLGDTLKVIATESGTDMQTVCNVLIVMALHFGRKVAADSTQAKMLEDTVARCMELEARLFRCRQVMEANDPGNAHDIFGPPLSEPQSGSPVAAGATAEAMEREAEFQAGGEKPPLP